MYFLGVNRPQPGFTPLDHMYIVSILQTLNLKQTFAHQEIIRSEIIFQEVRKLLPIVVSTNQYILKIFFSYTIGS